MTPSQAPKPMGKLLIETSMGGFPGDKRVRLREAMDRPGSIPQAAKAASLSCTTAWDAVDVEVGIGLEPELGLTALVTRESAQSLGLAPGWQWACR